MGSRSGVGSALGHLFRHLGFEILLTDGNEQRALLFQTLLLLAHQRFLQLYSRHALRRWLQTGDGVGVMGNRSAGKNGK